MALSECKVWNSFEGKRKDGKVVKLRFQELPLERTDEAFDLNNKYMLRDEACHKASGVYNNEEALNEYKEVLGKLLEVYQPQVTMCCVDDGSETGGDIAGVSMTILMKKNDSFYDFLKLFDVKTKEMQQLFKVAHVLAESNDLDEKFDSHYHGRGIVVHPDYRGMGIANEFVRIRRLVCIEQNIPMSSAWMTAVGTQRAGAKHDWGTYIELQPKDVGEKSGLKFDDDTLPFKLMYITKD